MISQRSRYALKALIHLARLGPGAARSTRLIALDEQIPAAFLEQIMLDLKRAGFVSSKRGKEGGYQLDKPPKSLTLATILRQIDGPVAPLPPARRRLDSARQPSVEAASFARVPLRFHPPTADGLWAGARDFCRWCPSHTFGSSPW